MLAWCVSHRNVHSPSGVVSNCGVRFAVLCRRQGLMLDRFRLATCGSGWFLHMRHCVTVMQVPRGIQHCMPFLDFSHGPDLRSVCIEVSVRNAPTTHARPLAVDEQRQTKVMSLSQQQFHHVAFSYRSVGRVEVPSCLTLWRCWMNLRTPCSAFVPNNMVPVGG